MLMKQFETIEFTHTLRMIFYRLLHLKELYFCIHVLANKSRRTNNNNNKKTWNQWVCFKMHRWFYFEVRNRVSLVMVTGTGCTILVSQLAQRLRCSGEVGTQHSCRTSKRPRPVTQWPRHLMVFCSSSPANRYSQKSAEKFNTVSTGILDSPWFWALIWTSFTRWTAKPVLRSLDLLGKKKVA